MALWASLKQLADLIIAYRLLIIFAAESVCCVARFVLIRQKYIFKNVVPAIYRNVTKNS
jgi:hypothetical protein